MDLFIPSTMMTQHPDSASRYVSVRDEPGEAIDALTPQPIGLGLEEVMVDYEGKLTPYHQTAEIALGLWERGMAIGENVLVTPRVPSATKETVFHQLMALMSVVESNYQLRAAGSAGAIREVVVPMVETASELVDVRRRIQDVIELGHKEFGISRDPNAVQVIPLVEEVPELLAAGRFLGQYIEMAAESDFNVSDLRIMLGRSDSAMVYGMVPSVLAVKIAVSDCYAMGREKGVGIYPIFGGGVLPFRGHVSLDNIEQLARDFAGIKTLTIQSGLRYDSGNEAARQVAIKARELLAGNDYLSFNSEERDELTTLVGIFTRHYLDSFAGLLPVVISISELIPRQRDRLARKSAVGYARAAAQPEKLAAEISDKEIAATLSAIPATGAKNLPRAISFTGALYSIGLPPEVIGTGRGLAEVVRRRGRQGLERLLGFYPGLKADMAKALRYASFETASPHLDEQVKKQIFADLESISEHLGISAGPASVEDQRYHILLETVQPMTRQFIRSGEHGADIVDRDLLTEWISRLGRIRGSLG